MKTLSTLDIARNILSLKISWLCLLTLAFSPLNKAFAENWDHLFQNHTDDKTNIHFLLDTGSSGYEFQHNDHPIVPASLTKIFTAQMALEELGKDFTFKTIVNWKSHPLYPQTIFDLTLVANGDPDFNILRLITKLKDKGFTNITGPIKIIDTLPRGKPKDKGWVNDSGYCYNSISNALNQKTNCATIKITRKGATILDPNLKVNIKLDLKIGAKRTSIIPHFLWLNKEQTKFSYFLEVNLRSRKSVRHIDVIIPYTNQWVINKIKRIAKENNFTFKKNKTSENDYKAHSLTLLSTPLKTLACTTLTKSQNMFADSIFRQIPLSAKEKFLSHYPEVHIVEGAGLSRENNIPAEATLALLQDIKGSSFFDFFLDCLPHPGEKGTLENRMLKLKNKIASKTGTLIGMSHLAGFIANPKDENDWLPYVFMMESTNKKAYQMRRFQDNIIEKVFHKIANN